MFCRGYFELAGTNGDAGSQQSDVSILFVILVPFVVESQPPAGDAIIHLLETSREP